MIRPQGHDTLVVAVVFIMAGLVFGATGLTEFLHAAHEDRRVAQFFAGYTFLLVGAGHLMFRARWKPMQRVAASRMEMNEKSHQQGQADSSAAAVGFRQDT